MMYLFDFFGFIFNELVLVLKFAVSVFLTVQSVITHLTTLVSALPLWLSVPFGALLAIAIVFRVSQFIPTIGGAS